MNLCKHLYTIFDVGCF